MSYLIIEPLFSGCCITTPPISPSLLKYSEPSNELYTSSLSTKTRIFGFFTVCSVEQGKQHNMSQWYPTGIQCSPRGVLLLAKHNSIAPYFKAAVPLKQNAQLVLWWLKNPLKWGVYLKFPTYAQLRQKVHWVILRTCVK